MEPFRIQIHCFYAFVGGVLLLHQAGWAWDENDVAKGAPSVVKEAASLDLMQAPAEGPYSLGRSGINRVSARDTSEHFDVTVASATFRSSAPSPTARHFTNLGRRDDSLAQGYSLEGRGKEVGAGPKSGRYCEPGMGRAGFPFCIRFAAKPGTDPDHSLGYVGGGSPFRLWGERRAVDEGTVGMDYSGWLFQRKTWLAWSHGGLYQGGAGRYQTEGPRLLPER